MRLSVPQRDVMRTLKWRAIHAPSDDIVLCELKALGLARSDGVGAACEWHLTADGADLVMGRKPLSPEAAESAA